MNYICSMKIILIIVFSIFILKINGRTSNEVRKTLTDGSRIIGRYQTTITGREILGFVGVPYAEPPIGELRFKAPVPKNHWTQPMMTIKDANKCTQLIPFQNNYQVEGSEDCLYLNIYKPLKQVSKSEVLPVMVFFHGGGWKTNSGGSKEYGPDYLLEHRIVLVTANYRLGPLGFLSTGTRDCPGNFGIKDQLLVLKWIQQNIRVFNGNPKSVTVFGVDAGAASITYLMQSPKAKGLIHKAIIQSGVDMNPWAQPAFKGVSYNRTRSFADQVKCKKDLLPTKWDQTMECLRETSAEALTLGFYALYRSEYDPMLPFSPVIEPRSPEAIITDNPRYAKNTHGRTIPIMIGMNKDEGSMISATITHSNNPFIDTEESLIKNLALTLLYDSLEYEDQEKIGEQIEGFYLDKMIADKGTVQNFTNLYTDAWFFAGIDEYLRKRLLEPYSTPTAATYVYLFSHKGSASYTETFGRDRENYYGVSHGDELRALFPVDDHLFINSIPSDSDTIMRTKMTKMWVNFATTGDPTPNNEFGFKWYGSPIFPINYLRIGNEDDNKRKMFEMENGLLEERANFWYDLQPHLPSNEWKQCASNY